MPARQLMHGQVGIIVSGCELYVAECWCCPVAFAGWICTVLKKLLLLRRQMRSDRFPGRIAGLESKGNQV